MNDGYMDINNEEDWFMGNQHGYYDYGNGFTGV